MIKRVKGQPITGAQPQYSSKRPFVPDAKDTSADEQVMIKEAPSPFKNRMQVPQIPAATHPDYRANPRFEKDALRYGGTGKSVSVRNAPTVNLGAVGEPRVPKGYNSINSGFATRNVQRTVGGGNQPKATKSTRAKYPGIFGR